MSTKRDTVLEVQGMTCSSCVRHVNEALADVDGVSRVDVRLPDGLVVVEHDARAAVERLVDVLREAGYESRPRLAA